MRRIRFLNREERAMHIFNKNRERIIVRSIIMSTIIILTNGCGRQKIPLKDRATKDIEFITQTISENHPGPYNTLDPHFMDTLKAAQQEALNKAQTIHSIDEYADVMEGYAKHFNDSHLRITIPSAHQNITQKGSPQSQESFALKHLTPSALWITLPTFDPNEKQQVQLSDLIAQLSKIIPSDVIIFDVRNNTGGNSFWGIKILSALFGEDYVDQQVKKMNRHVYVDWRVSKGNLEHIQFVTNQIKQLFGESSQEAHEEETVAKTMKQALKEGKQLVSEKDQPFEGKTSSFPAKWKNTKIIVLINHQCVSACLDFIDALKALDAPVTLIGKTTNADALYIETRNFELPSKLGNLMIPIKVYRNRPRGHNQPYEPDIDYRGDIENTKALEQWLINKLMK